MGDNKKIVSLIIIIVVLGITTLFVKNDWMKKQPTGVLDENRVQQREWESISENLPEQEIQEKVGEIIASKDFSGCEAVQSELYKKVCINNIALDLSQENMDVSYCQKIDNELVSRDDCERQVVFSKSVERESIDICDEAQNEEVKNQCKDAYYIALSLKKNDRDICGRVTDEDKKTQCLDEYVFRKEFLGNEQIFDCTRFHSQYVKNDCAMYRVENNENTDACREYSSSIFFRFCMINKYINK